MTNMISASEPAARVHELLGEIGRLEKENRLLRRTNGILQEQTRRMSEEIAKQADDLRRWEGSTQRFGDRLYHGRHTVNPRYSD